MDRVKIDTWGNISKDNWKTLLLGNGASIAIHSGFDYPTLRSVADTKKLLTTTAPIFAKIGTTDFEHVLLACWYAKRVNMALETPSDKISNACEEVRKALIVAVRTVHPVHTDITQDIQRAAAFASIFKTVVSLNYDLTLYWAMLLFNEKKGGPYFKDAFIHGKFEWNCRYLYEPHLLATSATLVFYPHGNLSLARDHVGNETKIKASPLTMEGLLKTITQKWKSGSHVPIFVSEGTSEEKLAAIHRSPYLTNIYENVLRRIGENLVVYGWSFDDSNQHVLNAISNPSKPSKPPKRIAVSVFTGQSDEKQQAFCHQVREVIGRTLADTTVTFFDSQSPGCWNNPLPPAT